MQLEMKTPAVAPLTRYPSGSMRELLCLSLPLMLSLMSSSLMLFSDRLFLARYSLDALNAATGASMLAAAIQFAFISTTCIAEVFVGQHNGAGRLKQLGEPVWQMLWFSLLSSLVFLPLGFWGGPYLFYGSPYSELEEQYFATIMLFGPLFCTSGALASFYIGRGKVHTVTITVILANVLNVVFDVVLIFGYEPWIEPRGVVGAALGTGIAQGFQALVLFLGFIRSRNRRLHGTGLFHFSWGPFSQCLRIGLPNAIAHSLEILAWACFVRMMTSMGEQHITVTAISQSIFFLFTFVTEGISKGATAIASNLIGAKEWNLVWKLLGSGVKFYLLAFLGLGAILVIDPAPLIAWFLPDAQRPDMQEVHDLVQSVCLWIWIFFLFDGINWFLIGLLTAAGDTQFVMKVGGGSVWVLAVLPIYIFVVKLESSVDVAWQITAFYAFIACCIYLWRFQSGKWRSGENCDEILDSIQSPVKI